MPWDDIEVGIGGDETANFGQRNETGPGLYQVDTLATVSNSGQVTKNPRLYAACSQLGLCLVADCQVSLFTETCDDHLITLTYGSTVDAVVCSQDSLFLLIGESSGTLHMMETNTQTLLFSESLVPDLQPVNGKAFCGLEITSSVEHDSYDLTILTSDGRLVRFCNINLKGIAKALEIKDFATAKKLKDGIQLEIVDTSSEHTEGTICLKCHNWGSDTVIITGGQGDSSICVWSREEADTTELLTGIDSALLAGSAVVKCDFKDNFLFVLTKKGVLSQWDAQSLIMLNKWPGLQLAVQDFLIMDASSVHSPSKNANLQSSLKIVLLTLPNKDGKCHLQVHSLPGMQLAYSLELNQVAALVCAPASQETIFVIEGAHRDDIEETSTSDGLVSTLRVRCLTESLPDTRFHRLLHKKQYQEALKFADTYELDVELVYKVKAQDILTQTDPWTQPQKDGQTTEQIFADLKDCLSHISDNGCVADICVQATLPTMQATHELLTYAEGRVNKKGGDAVLSEEELISRAAWQTKVLEALHRLGTFQVVFGPQLFSATQWYEFMKADLLVEVCEGFRRTDVQQAAAIWCRHQAEFEARFTVGWLKKVLQSITDNVLSDHILPWLRGDFVPFVLRVLPEGRAVLAQWLDQRTRNLELSEKAGWPENGLAMAELMVKVGGRQAEWENGKMLLTPAQLVTQCEHGISEAESSLNTLIQHLQHLLILHDRCNFKISLSEYCQETTTSITFRMLDRVVAPELIPATIDKMVRPYMKDHGLEEDKVLLQYIQDLLEQCSSRASYQLEASWEVKAITCVHCMKDMECKYEGTLLLMNKAVIPWSQAMETFVTEALKWKHPRASELQHRYSMINLRKMLANYALRNYNVSEFTTAPALLKYILYKDQPTVMQDALQVVEAYLDHLKKTDAYNIRIHFLIQQNRLSECMTLLKSLPKEEAEVCVRKIVIWAELTLQDSIITDEEVHKKNQMTVVEAALLALKHLADMEEDTANLLDYEEKLQDFQNIFALQKEYGEFMSRSEYQDPEFRKGVLMEHLAKFFQSMAQTDDMEDGDVSEECPCHDDRKRRPMKGNYSKMFRLAKLLGVSADELRGHLAVRASEDGNIDSAINMCQILYEQAPNATTGRVLYNVAHNLCSMQADPDAHLVTRHRSSIAHTIHQLASQALTICEQDLICDCLELCKCSSLSLRVYQKCEKAAYDVSVQPAEEDHLAGPQKDPYSEWTYDSFFKEDGLVLDTADAMPLTYQFTLACLPQPGCSVKGPVVPLNHARVAGSSSPEDDESSEHVLDEIHASTSSIVQYLQESSLYQLAFQFSVQALGVCLQHVLIDEILTLPTELQAEQQAMKTIKRQTLAAMVKQGSFLGSEFITALLTKLFSCRRVDHNLALGYVSVLNKADAFKKLKSQSSSAGLNYRRVLAIANVGKDLARLVGQEDVLKACKSLAADADWGHRLQKMKISFKDAFQNESAAKQKLLSTIIANEQTDLDLILDYCRTFRLNPSDALLLYLEYLLLLQPTLNPAGTSTVEDHIQHASQCVSKVQPIIDQIPVKDILLKRMANLLVSKINFYDYERIRFILSVMEVNMEREKVTFVWTIDLAKGLELLEFLWHYKRTQDPEQYELSFKPCADAGEEEDRKLFTEFVTAPLLAKKRLPFHPLLLGDPWKIIRPELSVETISALLPVTKLLKMPTDQVYVSAIQNMVNSCVKDHPRDVIAGPDEHSSQELRRLPGLDRKLVEGIRSLLLQVEDLQLAVATSRWVAKELPLGAEQVMALKACAFLTKKWKESLPENSPNLEKASIMLNRVTAATQQVATQHVLYKYRLAKTPYLSLANQPARLIFMLYKDDSIQKRLVEKAGVFPDIHAAAEEISQIGSRDLGKIRVTLFEEWLHASGGSKQGEEQDSTETLNFNEPQNQEAKEEEKSLQRMVYLMQFQAMEKSATFLLNIAYTQSGSKVTYISRVRALRCLLNLVDNQIIQAIANKPVEEIREYMKCLLYLAELEALHVPQTLESFNKSNKAALARGLWRNHNHEWRAVRLVSDLCLDYEIWDPHMWNSILQQLMAFRMLKYLEHVLIRLSAISDLWQVGCLMRAWKTVLLSPFTTACEDQKTACLNVYTLMQRCPLLLDLDVVGFSRQFLQAGLPACALGCLLFLPDDQKRNKHIQTLLASGSSLGILDQMRELDLARTPLSQGAQIVGEVYQYLDMSRQYDTVLGQPHYSSLQAYLVQQDRTSSLVQWLLDNDRLTEAIQLAQQYQQVHGDDSSSVTTKPQSGLQQLQAFLKSQGLSPCVDMLANGENGEDQPMDVDM